MSIEDRNVKPGTVLVAQYKKREHRAEVVAGEDGKPRYRLSDGRAFRSPSTAGSAVMGGVACNGWRFWSVAGGDVKPAKAAKSPRKLAAKDKSKSKAKPKVAKNGKGAATEIACGECGAQFSTSRETADHMRDEHGSAEAAGSAL